MWSRCVRYELELPVGYELELPLFANFDGASVGIFYQRAFAPRRGLRLSHDVRADGHYAC